MTRHINRTHKITLYPTPEQRRTLARNAGYPRLVYNWTLGYHERTLCDPSQLFTFWDDARTAAYPWSDELSQNAAKHAVYALEKAIKASEDTNRKNEYPKAPSPEGESCLPRRQWSGQCRVRGHGHQIAGHRRNPHT